MTVEELLNNKLISWECKGMIAYLAKHREVDTPRKLFETNSCAEKKTRRILEDLEHQGLVEVRKTKNNKGQFLYKLIVNF